MKRLYLYASFFCTQSRIEVCVRRLLYSTVAYNTWVSFYMVAYKPEHKFFGLEFTCPYPFIDFVLLSAGMILRNHTYLKVYKCWWILPILKTPTIKWLNIFFKKYFNFQGFYIVYIIICWFLEWKCFTPSKLDEISLQNMQIGK